MINDDLVISAFKWLIGIGAAGITGFFAWVRSRMNSFQREQREDRKYFQRKADECDEEKEKLWRALRDAFGAQSRIDNCPAGTECQAKPSKKTRKIIPRNAA